MFKSLSLEEARALVGSPPIKPPPADQERLTRELKELGDAFKLLPRVTEMTDEEILGFNEFDLPGR